jgi:hypothetical protein
MFQPPPMSRPRTAIPALRRGHASRAAVLRALVEHREWLVPVSFFPRERVATCGKVSFGPRSHMPPGELWIFTETATVHAALAHGAVLGSYVPSIQGTELFGALTDEVRLLRVNPSGYADDLLAFEPESFPELRAWADRVRHEQRLLGTKVDPAALRACPELHVPLLPDGRMIAKPGHDGFAQPGVVCTSLDCYEAFVGALDPGLAAQLRHVVVDGETFLRDMSRQREVDALYFNPFGPAPTRTWSRAAL